MKIKHTPEMTFEGMAQVIKTELPQYTTTLKKNPLMRFQYIEVKKSGTVGVWIRVFDKKGKVQLMNAMPSTAARAFLGGVLILMFVWGAQSKVRKETGALLIEKFGTQEY